MVDLKVSQICVVAACIFMLCCLLTDNCMARPRATMKYVTEREESRKMGKETLLVPYAFPSESMGLTFGVGGLAKGYIQDQLMLAGTVFGSVDSALAGVLGLWDYKLPYTERFYASTMGSWGYYPRQRAYAEAPGGYSGVRAGSNDSAKEDYIQDSGQDNWWEVKLEYVLPIGGMKHQGAATYKLKRGLLVSGASGGDSWNPLASGATVAVVRQYNRYQTYERDEGVIDGAIHALEFGLLYNNTDFAANPSTGSSQYLSVSHDFGWLESDHDWTFVEFEASKYFDMGPCKYGRQRVVALNFWTGESPSWDKHVEGDLTYIDNKPPFAEGAKLGGFYRLRAYPNNRFNDKAVIYSTAEYRFMPEWNPLGEISWLSWLKMDWMQLVGFVEGGRVAEHYSYSDLSTDWKGDVGVGLRTMLAGGVARLDFAVAEEASAVWVMFGHPF